MCEPGRAAMFNESHICQACTPGKQTKQSNRQTIKQSNNQTIKQSKQSKQ
jgi:hypothetical protein